MSKLHIIHITLYIFKKSKLPEDHRKFCELRNKVQRQVKTAKLEYFSNQIEQDRDNPKKIWKHLKDIGLKGKQKEDSAICLKIFDDICHDSKMVANHFNNFFTTIASTLVSKLPKCTKVFDYDSVFF